MLYYMLVVCSFYLQNNILLYGYTKHHLSIHQLTDIWAIFTFWLLCKYCYDHLCGHMFFTYFIYILLRKINRVYINSKLNHQTVFNICIFYIITNDAQGFLISIYSCQQLSLSIFFIKAILICVMWYLSLVFIYSCLYSTKCLSVRLTLSSFIDMHTNSGKLFGAV